LANAARADELGSATALPSGGHDAQLVQEHLGALIRVRGFHAGDHPDHGSRLIVVREQQVMAGAAEKLLGLGGLGRLVEELPPASTTAASMTRSIRMIAP